MIFVPMLFLLLGLAFVLQAFMPEIEWAFASTVYLVHLVFLAGAVTVSYPVMLVMAFCAGFAWDAVQLVPTSGQTDAVAGDVAFGYSILLFGLSGSLMQGIRPLFRRGRWELPVLMVGGSMLLYLTIEYLMINFVRGEFIFPKEVLFKIVTMSLMAMAPAPLLFWVLYRLARVSGYEIHYEGLTKRSVRYV